MKEMLLGLLLCFGLLIVCGGINKNNTGSNTISRSKECTIPEETVLIDDDIETKEEGCEE